MILKLKICFAVVVFLYSCNRPQLGGGDEIASAPKTVSIKIDKLSNSSKDSMGKARVVVRSFYKLSLLCENCAMLGIVLPFVEAPREGQKYVYSAEFDYALVNKTSVCEVDISAMSTSSNVINARKRYSIYLCPLVGTSEECNQADAVPDCTPIGR